MQGQNGFAGESINVCGWSPTQLEVWQSLDIGCFNHEEQHQK